MRLSALAAKATDGKDNALICDGICRIRLVATTVPTSLIERQDSVTAFAFSATKEGLLALVAYGSDRSSYTFFVEIKKKAGEQTDGPVTEIFYPEIDKQWLPSPTRPGQIVPNGGAPYLIISIDGQTYASKKGIAWYFVPDTDLLLRYLYNLADEAEVKAAAREEIVAEDARTRLPEVEAKLKAAEERIIEEIELNRKNGSCLEITHNQNDDLRKENRRLENEIARLTIWRTRFNNLVDLVRDFSLTDLINNFRIKGR